MLVVVYDISDDRRRRRLHRELEGLGRAVQYSAFECPDDTLESVLLAIDRHVRRQDRIRVYRLCKRCSAGIYTVGDPLEAESHTDDLVYVHDEESAEDEEATGPLERGEAVVPSYLMERICSMDNLKGAWKRVKSNRGCAGADGVGLQRFESGLAERLARLQEELASGSYRAQRLKTFSIAKASGGSRKISVPTVRDRIAQQAVLRVIGPVLDDAFEESSFGYRPGRSVRQAIHAIERWRDAGYGWVLDADVTDYFGTIDREELMEVFRRHVSDESVVRLVEQWVTASQEAPTRQESQLRGVPQGGVLSPLLANLYLDAFDERIEQLGYKLVRYADDFVVLCSSREQVEQALVDVGVLLRELRLELNKSKTRVTSFAEGFHFLGYLLVGRIAMKVERSKLLKSGAVRVGRRGGR